MGRHEGAATGELYIKDGACTNQFYILLLRIIFVPIRSCVEDESTSKNIECGTSTLTITIEENVSTDFVDTTITSPTLSTESITQSSLQLIPTSNIVKITKHVVVAIHETTAVVGSFGNEGVVVVFTRDIDSGEWMEQGTLSTPDSAQFTSFGGSIDIWGDTTIIVGAWGDSDKAAGVYNMGAANKSNTVKRNEYQSYLH